MSRAAPFDRAIARVFTIKEMKIVLVYDCLNKTVDLYASLASASRSMAL